MAKVTSGVYEPYLEDGTIPFTLNWWISSHDPVTKTTKISFEAIQNISMKFLFCDLSLITWIGNSSSTSFKFSNSSMVDAGMARFKETVTLPIGVDRIGFNCSGRTMGGLSIESERVEFELSDQYIPEPSTVSCSTTKIGSNPVFSIKKMDEYSVSTLTYQFGSLTGTIVEKYDGYDYSDWTIPMSFYEQIPNSKYDYCTITCTSYLGTESLGSTTTKFIVEINEDDCRPIMDPIVMDNNSETVAITGNSDIIIERYSYPMILPRAQGQYGATIAEQYYSCGTKSDTFTGSVTIMGVDSGSFFIRITDSRGVTASTTITKQFIEYVNLTCDLFVNNPATDGTWTFSISGDYHNGSFYNTANTLLVRYRWAENENAYSNWITVTPTISGNSYDVPITIRGLNYKNIYRVQAVATDKFETVYAQEAIVRSTPIFEWNNDSFTFNVPVNYSEGSSVYNLDMKKINGLLNAMTTSYSLDTTVTAGSNYKTNYTIGSATLLGPNLRCYLYGSRNNPTGAGNIANEIVATFKVVHNGKIKAAYVNTFGMGAEGAVASFVIANASNDGTTLTFDVSLAAIEETETVFSTYFIIPVLLNPEAFTE